MSIVGAFQRDENFVPITDGGITICKEVTLSASNTTASVDLFTVTGSVEVTGLWGVVTTVLGSNQTAAYWRLNDGAAQSAISLATGTTISNLPVGSLLSRRSLVSVALVASTAAQEQVVDPVAATAPSYFMPFVLVQKTAGATSTVQLVYTTTNTPTSGAIKFFIRWLPLSTGSKIQAV